MILPIYIYGQPVLRKVAQPIDKDYPNLAELIQNMKETMYDSDGIGIAAPQVGVSARVVYIDVDALKDKFADLKNTGSDAGAIAAALFLQEFVPENTAWAHWDIAGTAFTTKKWKYTEYGATGFGVQTLIELAREMSQTN